MKHAANRFENDLRPLKVRFLIAAALFLVVAIVSVSQFRWRRHLEKTSEELTRAKSGLVRVREANVNRRLVLTALQSKFAQGAQNSSPEMVLYTKIDDIRASLKPDDMTISAVTRGGGEASIQYTLTFKNPEFNNLLNTVSHLHGAVFPLTPVSSIVVTPSGADGVSYTVAGAVITNERIKP